MTSAAMPRSSLIEFEHGESKMSEVIFKTIIGSGGNFLLPVSAKPLHVHEQDGRIVLWFRCDPDDKMVSPRTFHVIGTGNRFELEGGELNYIGTAHIDGYVWHVFENVNLESGLVHHTYSKS